VMDKELLDDLRKRSRKARRAAGAERRKAEEMTPQERAAETRGLVDVAMESIRAGMERVADEGGNTYSYDFNEADEVAKAAAERLEKAGFTTETKRLGTLLTVTVSW
jgi:hypothetical protein